MLLRILQAPAALLYVALVLLERHPRAKLVLALALALASLVALGFVLVG